MRKLLLLLFAFTSFSVSAQKLVDPPVWQHYFAQKEAKVGDVVELVIKTDKIPTGFYIYSNDFDEYLGPIPASLSLEKHPSYELVGGLIPKGAHTHYDDVWEGDVSTFDNGKAEFRQKVKILSANPVIKGILDYQMCKDVCVGFELDLDFKNIKVSGSSIATPKVTTNDKTQTTEPADTTSESSVDTAKASTTINEVSTTEESKDDGDCEVKTFKGNTGKKASESYWGFFLVAFLSGLTALLTPCVFPMIPMTVSFFMKDGGNRKKGIKTGLIYAFSIIVIYTLIGTLVTLFFGADVANFLSTHWIPNVFFFIIFIVFAASFFGMFEIVLPNWMISKMDKKADQGGLMGIFFMAFTLVLVSFSCTGPIVGQIIVLATQGAGLKPLVGMFGFSLAFALPFGLFAIFPSWLSSLPKSGGWLNSVKVVLGFVELALAFKFLSIADQTYHWGLLDREIYVAIWIVIAILLGVYLLGKLKFAHDSDIPYLKVPRLLLAVASFSFAVYLLPGMFGASLPGMAGYLPPMSTHDFDIPNMIREANQGNTKGEGLLCEEPLYADKLHFPHGLVGYFQYEQGMRCGKQLKKPVLLDFTGHGCVNCRKMEEKVWAEDFVLDRIKKEYVLVSLYVDDKLELPENQWKVSKVTGKTLKSIGKINADIQICMFGSNAQPWYILIDPIDGELLAQPRDVIAPSSEDNPNPSSFNAEDFADFLDDGVKLFYEKHPELKEKK